MLLSSVIYIPIFSTYTVPYNSLANELTPDYDERTSLMTYKSAMQKVFEVAMFFALQFTTLNWFLIPGTTKHNTLFGMQVYTSALGVIMAIFAIIMFIRLREPYYESIVLKTTETRAAQGLVLRDAEMPAVPQLAVHGRIVQPGNEHGRDAGPLCDDLLCLQRRHGPGV